MLNLDHLRRRLSHYGLAWLAGFVTVLGAALIARYGLKADLIRTVDQLIPVGLAALAAAMAAGVVASLMAREGAATKIAVVLLAVVLILPLLWAPVLAAVVAAWIGKVSIEYSSAYAGFRIAVADILYPITKTLFSHALLETVWLVFQGLATVVGFLSALAQVWPMLKRLVAKPA